MSDQQIRADLIADAEHARERANMEIAEKQRYQIAYTLSEQKRLVLIDRAEAAEAECARLITALETDNRRIAEKDRELAAAYERIQQLSGDHGISDRILAAGECARLRETLTELADGWTQSGNVVRGFSAYGLADAYDSCADALRAALASPGTGQEQERAHGRQEAREPATPSIDTAPMDGEIIIARLGGEYRTGRPWYYPRPRR